MILITLLLSAWLLTVATAHAQTSEPPTPTPPATETPPPTPAPGTTINIIVPGDASGGPSASGSSAEPMLNVVDYGIDPNPLRSEQTFTLTVTVKNAGAKHADEVTAAVASNEQFVGVSAPAELGKIEPGETRSFSLPVRAGKLNGGAYDLNLIFRYRVGEGQEQSVTRSIGLLSSGGGTSVSGKARVIIESANVRPTGEAAFDVELVFRNVGRRTAYDVNAALKLNEYLSPVQGSGSARLGDLKAGQAVTHTLSLALSQAHPAGRIAQTFGLEYRDAVTGAQSAEETVSLEVGAAGQQNPRLLITRQSTVPDQPAPGEPFTLTLTIKNVGPGTARHVMARFGGEEGLKPFIPLGGSNVLAGPDIAPGETITLSQRLMLESSASGGTYPLNISLSYENTLGEAETEAELIGVLAITRPQLQIGLSKPVSDGLSVGQTFDIPVEIINVGRQRVDVNTVEIVSADLTLTKSALYVGPLDPSISGALTARATATRAGLATARVIIHYRDELNQMRTVEKELTFEIQASADLAPETETAAQAAVAPDWWTLVRRFFGLGG